MKESRVKVAVIQDAPVLFDKTKTIERVISLIDEASGKGAEILLFPESFVPAYPRGLSFGTVIGNRSELGKKLWQIYWENSLLTEGEDILRIKEAAKRNKVFVSLGITERDNEFSGGSLYCTQVYIDDEGNLRGKHRKIKPTGTERLIWADGDGSTLSVIKSKFGNIGGLTCWENYMPLARMAIYGKGVEIYMAPTADAREVWISTMRHIACEGRCFVLGCNQYVTKDMYPADLPGIEDIADQNEIMCRGGSVIVNPTGDIIAGPLWDERGILYADLDLSLVVKGKMDFDVVGHYSRPDIFNLTVDEKPKKIIE